MKASPRPVVAEGSDASLVPTDLELMLWADGELSGQRAREVAAFVAKDARARDVVASMRTCGDLLSEHVLLDAHASGADSIVDNIGDIIEVEASRRLISSKPAKVIVLTWRAPAAAAMGLAIAAAAAWFMFFRTVDVNRFANTPAVAAMNAEANQAETADADPINAFIDVVDFGSRPGTIFYVPSEGESVAVIWLTDDDSSPTPGDAP